jgi:hypothetical protein
MKKLILFLLFVISISNLFSQNFYLGSGIKTSKCKYRNDGGEGYYAANWDIYYTKNNEIDGEIDSLNSCIEFEKASNFGFLIKLKEFDKTRPLFFKYNFSQQEKIYIRANSVYTTNIELNSNKNGVFIKSTDCNESCGKIQVIINEYYGDSLVVKKYDKYANSYSGYEYLTGGFCNTANKVDSTILTELKFSVKFDENFEGDANVFFNGASIMPLWELNQIKQSNYLLDKPIIDSTMNIEPGLLSGRYFGSNIVLHTLPGYQSDKNIDKKLLSLKNNVAYPVNIKIIISEISNLFFQEYTALVPDKILGSDSIFHQLELVLDGGEFCLNFVDVLIDDHVNFRYKNGDLFIAGNSGCMAFRKQSKLIVDPHSNLYYGYNGNGMLALNGSKVEILDYATLHMSGKIVLVGNNNAHIHLFPNSKLIFGKGSSIKSLQNLNERINIYGFPWQVDVTALDLDSRSKLNFIIPKKEGEVLIYPNPATSMLYLTSSHYHKEPYIIFDTKSSIVQKGIIEDNGISIDHLPQNIYFIKIGPNIQKFVKSKL